MFLRECTHALEVWKNGGGFGREANCVERLAISVDERPAIIVVIIENSFSRQIASACDIADDEPMLTRLPAHQTVGHVTGSFRVRSTLGIQPADGCYVS
jgi:hypothetical protein